MPIKDLPKEVVLVMQDLLILIHKTELSDSERLWYKKMFDTAIRHLEFFIVPLVSIKAQKIADANNLGDLRFKRYRTPSAWPKGKELYWEHAKPVLDIRKLLIELGANPTTEDILSIVNQAEITWITRDEARTLTKTGRVDWRDEYKRRNINFI